jgi:hypothetical protein
MKTTYGFSRRGPDRVAEELASVLSNKSSFEFKALFDIVHANLRAKNAASGGEEMLRLRLYEKLQNFVQAGFAKKVGKEYKGVPKGIENFLATAADLNAKFAAGTHSRPPVLSSVAKVTATVAKAVEKIAAPAAARATAPRKKAAAKAKPKAATAGAK